MSTSNIPDHERLVSTKNSKVINLQNLLKDATHGNEAPINEVVAERKDNIPLVDTNTYLRSNLAQLSPELSQYGSYQLQPSLTSGSYGAQYSFNTMPKTQETSWIRPNAQSELASALTTQGVDYNNARSNIAHKQVKNFVQGFSKPDISTRSKVSMPSLAALFQQQQDALQKEASSKTNIAGKKFEFVTNSCYLHFKLYLYIVFINKRYLFFSVRFFVAYFFSVDSETVFFTAYYLRQVF